MVVTFAQVMLFYVLLTVALSVASYLTGYDIFLGFIAGVIISAILWFTVGKKMVNSN